MSAKLPQFLAARAYYFTMYLHFGVNQGEPAGRMTSGGGRGG